MQYICLSLLVYNGKRWFYWLIGAIFWCLLKYMRIDAFNSEIRSLSTWSQCFRPENAPPLMGKYVWVKIKSTMKNISIWVLMLRIFPRWFGVAGGNRAIIYTSRVLWWESDFNIWKWSNTAGQSIYELKINSLIEKIWFGCSCWGFCFGVLAVSGGNHGCIQNLHFVHWLSHLVPENWYATDGKRIYGWKYIQWTFFYLGAHAEDFPLVIWSCWKELWFKSYFARFALDVGF